MVMGGGGVRRWFEEALGQRLNLAAAASSFRVVATEEGRRLAIPHVWAPDIRWVDWRELKRLGFRGVVFDKDNTLTAPYSLSLWPPISASFADCVAAFPGRLAVFSNSAGNDQSGDLGFVRQHLNLISRIYCQIYHLGCVMRITKHD